MKKCPSCSTGQIRYWELFFMHRGNTTICSSCGTILRCKPWIAVLNIVFLFVLIPLFCIWFFGISPNKFDQTVMIVAYVSFVIFFHPYLIQLQEIKNEAWLPKSRVLGYTIFLLIPIIVIFAFVILAVKLEM